MPISDVNFVRNIRWSSGHGRARVLGTSLCNDTVELVEIGVEVEDWRCTTRESAQDYRFQKAIRTVDRNPFHDIAILRQHHDCLEIALHESSICKGTAEVQRLRSWAGRRG